MEGGCNWEERASPTLFSFPSASTPFAHISQSVHLVLSVSSDSSLGETLEQSQGAHVVALGPLDPSARARLVREELALYAKRLDESPFNNQVGRRPGLVGVWGEAGSCEDQGAEAASCPTQTSCFFIFPGSLCQGKLLIR